MASGGSSSTGDDDLSAAVMAMVSSWDEHKQHRAALVVQRGLGVHGVGA